MSTDNLFSITFAPVALPETHTPLLYSGYGRLQLCLGGEVIWELEEFWDGLLDHLANAWPYLLGEQAYPLGHNPPSPVGFLETALNELAWGEEPAERLFAQEREISAFSDRHNLAAGMIAIHLPAVFLLREGRMMRVVSEERDISVPFDEAIATLCTLGDDLAQAVSSESERGRGILARWRQRREGHPVRERLRIITGMTEERLERIAAGVPLEAYYGSADLGNPGRVQIAARMVGNTLLDEEIQAVLKRVRDIRLTRFSDEFEKLKNNCGQFMAGRSSLRAFDEGYALASRLREQLALRDLEPVAVEELLREWGINIVVARLNSDTVDAIACWDSGSACILINGWGRRAKYPSGRRSSLAHELCHLLLDTEHALPDIEILGGRMPKRVEQRANAFAAEFLLPRSHVRQAMPASPSREQLQALLDQLVQSHQVSHTLAAWQIRNAFDDPAQFPGLQVAEGPQGASRWIGGHRNSPISLDAGIPF